MDTINQETHIVNVEILFNDLLTMPYFRNYAATSGNVHNISNHESAVESVFRKNNITQILSKDTRITTSINKESVKNAIKDKICIIPDNTYISQPCGTHDSPDFLVNINGRIYGFECKSTTGRNYKPLYNSGGIKSSIIYIFTNESVNATTLYLGRDIITKEQSSLITELIQKQRKIEQEYNVKLSEIDTNNRGISYYTRAMIGQQGNSSKTNYFSHDNKKICEENVLKFLMDYE